MSLIEQSEITDLVTPVKRASGLGFSFPGGLPISEEFAPYINEMREQAEHSVSADFSVSAGNVYFRGRKLETVEGGYYAFRRIASAPWEFSDVGLNSIIANHLMDPSLSQGGLVAIVGRPGQGKSTTCAAAVVERLKRFGGFCLTIEDPVEVRMQGTHGEGRCLQMDVSSGREAYREAIMGSMRASPAGEQAIVYVGEIRDGYAAANLLRGALDGRLVFTTLHAADPEKAVERLASLAAGEVGETEARSLLAAGFRLIVHQEIKDGQLRITPLINTNSVASNIRNGKFQMILGDRDRQATNLMNSRPLNHGY